MRAAKAFFEIKAVVTRPDFEFANICSDVSMFCRTLRRSEISGEVMMCLFKWGRPVPWRQATRIAHDLWEKAKTKGTPRNQNGPFLPPWRPDYSTRGFVAASQSLQVRPLGGESKKLTCS